LISFWCGCRRRSLSFSYAPSRLRVRSQTESKNCQKYYPPHASDCNNRTHWA
jgi:hypothetical protein